MFSRVGTRKGDEIAWVVEKEQNWYEPSTASSTQSVKEAFSSAFDPDDN